LYTGFIVEGYPVPYRYRILKFLQALPFTAAEEPVAHYFCSSGAAKRCGYDDFGSNPDVQHVTKCEQYRYPYLTFSIQFLNNLNNTLLEEKIA
jgi:hypothetical protein